MVIEPSVEIKPQIEEPKTFIKIVKSVPKKQAPIAPKNLELIVRVNMREQ